MNEKTPPTNRTRRSARTAAWVLLLVVGAFLALGSVYDLISAARGQLPSDHASTFAALTGTSWQDATSVSQPTTPYVRLMEIDYAVYELLFAALFLIVVAIPLRRGERWAWWSCWLIILPELVFAALFGAHDATNLVIAIAVAVITAGALLALGSRLPRREQRAG
jgi:hypothetical protein